MAHSPQSPPQARTTPNTPAGSRLAPLHLFCALLASGLAGLWWWQRGWTFPLDDAYITLHNARVLLTGQDPGYGVSALVGATSLVHLALVTLLAAFVPAGAASYLLSCSAILLFLAGLFHLGRAGGLPPRETVVLALAGTATAAPHLLNGLETGLGLAAATWALVLACRPAPSRILPALCGLLPFIRPEFGLLGLLLLGRQAWLCARDPISGIHATGGAWRRIAGDIVLAGLAALPCLVWLRIETGSFAPNTLGAKAAFFPSPTTSLAEALVVAVLLSLTALGPAAAGLVRMRRDALALVLLLFVAGFLLAYAATAPEVLGHNGYRYAANLLPVALCGLVRTVRPEGGLREVRILLAAQCAVAVFTLATSVDRIAGNQATIRGYAAVADWAQANLPPGARVLIHDAGVMAERTTLPLVDVVGLKTPSSVADHRRWTAPTGGADRWRALDAIARRSGATHAVILDDGADGFWGALAADLRRGGWTLDPLFPHEPAAGYRLYRLTPPPG